MKRSKSSSVQGLLAIGYVLLAAMLVAMYLPVVMIFIYSFNKSRIGTVWTGFSTRWYEELFFRPDLWNSLQMSLLIGCGCATLSVVLGAIAAWGLHRSRQGLASSTMKGLLYLPLVLPDVTLGMSLALLFYFIGIQKGFATIVLAQSVCGMCYAYVVVAAALQKLDTTLYDAAMDCGATPWQVQRFVVLPLMLPSMMTAWLFALVLSFDDFLIAFFTKGVGTDTLPIKIFSMMRFGVRPDINALFSILFAIAAIGLFLFAAMQRDSEGDAAASSH